MNKLMYVLLQGDFQGELSTILTSYVKPILIILVIIAAIKGLVNAVELIMDKEERGTTKDGFLKLALIVGGVALLIIVLNVILNKLSGINLTM